MPAHGVCRLLWRVITPLTKRVAATNAPDAFETAADCPVFLHGSNEVVAARRLKTALAADDGAECPLVDADEENEQEAWDANAAAKEIHIPHSMVIAEFSRRRPLSLQNVLSRKPRKAPSCPTPRQLPRNPGRELRQ